MSITKEAPQPTACAKGREAPPRVLLADDQQDVLTALKLLLADEDYTLVTATSPGAVRRELEESDFDAVVMGLSYTRDTTSGQEGLTLLQVIRGMDDTLPVIVMTASERRERGGGEAARRQRLHRKALERRPPDRYATHADRPVPCTTQGTAAGGGQRCHPTVRPARQTWTTGCAIT